jgi:hypothetical protein
MTSIIPAPTDNPPAGCTETDFALWQAGFRQRRSAELIAQSIPAQRIRIMVDLEVEAARRRSRPIESEVQA